MRQRLNVDSLRASLRCSPVSSSGLAILLNLALLGVRALDIFVLILFLVEKDTVRLTHGGKMTAACGSRCENMDGIEHAKTTLPRAACER